MKLDAPANANYAATVVKILNIVPLDNCDNVVGTTILGFQAIVGKDTQVGDLGVVFTAETQLSDEFASYNNLYRHGDKNLDQSKKGYLEDNRRIKALKFRGHRSDALFLSLDSLGHTGVDVSEFVVGMTFDKINGHDICEKYLIKRPGTGMSRVEKNKNKVFTRVDKRFLPEHYDTDNFFRNADALKPEQHIVVTQKLHGTSIRIGNTVVQRKLTWLERIAQKLGVKVATTEYDMVYGSRKVIKDINNPNQQHFYGTDIWTEEGAKLNGIIPEGFIVYGELIGYTSDGAPIQKNYTYQVPEGTSELFVYRVAFVNGQGRIVDLAWQQVKEFCTDLGLKHVPELWCGLAGSFTGEELVEDFLDKTFSINYPQAVPLAKESPCDEGICIRVDGLAPYILKAKSPKFFEHETKMLDAEVFDLEAEASLV